VLEIEFIWACQHIFDGIFDVVQCCGEGMFWRKTIRAIEDCVRGLSTDLSTKLIVAAMAG
jgi:hypothetical protein